MADDAAGTDDAGEDDRRSSTPGPDAHRSSDERPTRDDREPTDRRDRFARDDGPSGSVVDDDSDEYRIPLDLSRDDDATRDDRDPDGAEDGDDQYAPEPSSTPIEPGDPDLENVIFVFLGAVAMALVLFRIMSLPL